MSLFVVRSRVSLRVDVRDVDQNSRELVFTLLDEFNGHKQESMYRCIDASVEPSMSSRLDSGGALKGESSDESAVEACDWSVVPIGATTAATVQTVLSISISLFTVFRRTIAMLGNAYKHSIRHSLDNSLTPTAKGVEPVIESIGT